MNVWNLPGPAPTSSRRSSLGARPDEDTDCEIGTGADVKSVTEKRAATFKQQN